MVACIVASSSVARAQLIEQWDFNGDLAGTTPSNDLVPVAIDGTPVVGFAAEEIGGETADVATFSDITALRVDSGASGNGGGAFVNLYTIIMDVRFDDAGTDWTCLFQTNACTGTDPSANPLDCANDGDAFVNPGGGIGISGDYDGVLDTGWHRLAITVNLNDTLSVMRLYIDGAFVNEVELGGNEIDGRWSLFPVDDPSTPWLFLFADNSGASEMSAGAINSFQFRDSVATDEQIAAFGGPSAAGIPAPLVAEVPLLGGWGIAALVALVLSAGGLALSRRRVCPVRG